MNGFSVKRLLVFGGAGFVGGHLAALALEDGWQVVVADLAAHPGVEGVEWEAVDITQPDAIERVFQKIRPEGVVNVAALADIDRVERDRELAWKINVDGAGYIAQNCARNGCTHVFFSSDAVFDGVQGPYAEDDLPNPVNFYGITKVEAEKAVLSAHPQAVIIRISLVLGLPITTGNSFLAGLKDKLQAGKVILCPVDEIRTPLDVHTLSACVLELLRINYAGRLHIGCTESIDRYSLTQRLAQELGYAQDLVQPQAGQPEQAGRAPRHKKGALDVSKAQRVLKTRLIPLDETIRRAVLQKNPITNMEKEHRD